MHTSLSLCLVLSSIALQRVAALPQGPLGSCFASLLLIPDCARQAEAASSDVNSQNEEALQCILDNIVVESRAQRVGKTYPIDFIRINPSQPDNGAIVLFNKPAGSAPFPFASALVTENGQPGGTIVTSLKFWRRQGYSAVVSGILQRPYERIIADIFEFVPTLPVINGQTVRAEIRRRIPFWGFTTTGLTCKP
ncbi:hypothetical protein CAC42_6881 [Sphaceloma murrayae]|uniref:Uncharacterized protein n=1 Tax=Sphaceloma murrayae TaxID=2082308 RepID=A0A2K1QGR1_9PEZI|nr:hypothetical protein CAC42_6881 [Sphaceloma murrayae]